MNPFLKSLEALLDWGGVRRDMVFLILSGLALVCSMFQLLPLPFDAAWIAIVLCGLPIVLEAIIGLVSAFDIKADVLVSLALVASVAIGEHFAAGEVAFIMQLGGFLEDLTVSRARAGIEKLLHLTPQTARVLTPQGEQIIPAHQVQVGCRIRVLPGETVPADGIIVAGQTSINQAVMTGESLPVDKGVGDQVSSGTVNQFGAFELEATRVGEDSSIQRMIRLVQSADAGKAKIVGIADRWATWIVMVALTAAVLTWLVTGALIRAVTILVVFCPCALVLATPTAIMAAIGNATKHGFLVREGDALERLAGVDCITFDKTGTLTHGVPTVVEVQPLSGYSREEVYRLAAAAEQLSEHPLGKAMVQCYGNPLPPVTQFRMHPGQGVEGMAEGRFVQAGTLALLGTTAFPPEAAVKVEQALGKGCTVIYIAIDRVPAGFVALSDTIRPESAPTLASLRRLDIQPVLLTGDHQSAAAAIGKELGVEQICAGCLPEDKLNYIRTRQEKGAHVCMIGDGINDAPALKQADVGIAMGGVGSDIAVDAADIALVNDEIKELPHLLALSKRMMATIRLNLCFSMGLNFLAIFLAITGLLGPVVGALVHNAGSVVVILHSALLLDWKRPHR